MSNDAAQARSLMTRLGETVGDALQRQHDHFKGELVMLRREMAQEAAEHRASIAALEKRVADRLAEMQVTA